MTPMRLRGRRLLAAASLLAALPAAGLLLLLALLPPLLGRTTGAGFASVEAALCVHARGGPLPVIIGGDSRALLQADPRAVTARTGLRCVNVADWMGMGGEFATLANSLRARPDLLAQRPLVVASVSMEALNDRNFANLGLAEPFNWTLADHARLAATSPGGYFPWLARVLLPAARRELGHRLRGDGFACVDEVALDPRVEASLGFLPVERDPGAAATAWAAEFALGGVRWRRFREDVADLARSGPRGVVIVNAPLNPAWTSAAEGTALLAAERAFSRDLAGLEGPGGVPGARVLDYAAALPEGLGPEHFWDRNHLTAEGAAIFSRVLADTLAGMLGSGGRVAATR